MQNDLAVLPALLALQSGQWEFESPGWPQPWLLRTAGHDHLAALPANGLQEAAQFVAILDCEIFCRRLKVVPHHQHSYLAQRVGEHVKLVLLRAEVLAVERLAG